MIGESEYAHFRESLDVIRAAGTAFDVAEYLAGRQTPVFFGSALTNFGLEPFLQALVELAPPPQPRPSDSGIVSPTDERFTGFVFKIQANMDPRHRDRVAFVRVCSGRFTKDMTVSNSRVGKAIRASRAYRFFGRDRETISVAYAGDIIGLVNPGQFAIGDTIHSGAPLRFLDLPRFPAEHFGRVRLQDTRYKQFDEGLRQLEEEGLMQVFYVTAGRREPIVGVVGALQFDVIASRLRTEYGVEVEIEPAAYTAARWLANPTQPVPPLGGQSAVAVDRQERRVLLFSSDWELQYFERQHPDRRAAGGVAGGRLDGQSELAFRYTHVAGGSVRRPGLQSTCSIKERPHGTKEGVRLSPGALGSVSRVSARRHQPPRLPGSRQEICRRRPDGGRDPRDAEAELRLGAAGAERRCAAEDRLRHRAVAAGQRQHQGLFRASGEGAAASCPACSSSTRIAD